MTFKPIQLENRSEFVELLHTRFIGNMHRHRGVDWDNVLYRIEHIPDVATKLYNMETTGGEPDIIGVDSQTGQFIFCDCFEQSPMERRSLCYDEEALQSRKTAKPRSSAMGMAQSIGVELITEEEYFLLQSFGPVDTKTSSWIKTPTTIRELGGALFGDHRFGRTFIFHNGAESYYADRGFRATLRV